MLQLDGIDRPSPQLTPEPKRHGGQLPDPTPDEIAECCREIQAGWSPQEEMRRRVIQPTEWSVPRFAGE